MSSVYQPKRKELAKVQVVSSETYSANRSKLKLVGRIKRGYTTFITTQSDKKTGMCSFVDDTSSLTKKTKNEIVRFFSKNANEKKQVVYLVVPKTVNKPQARNPKYKVYYGERQD